MRIAALLISMCLFLPLAGPGKAHAGEADPRLSVFTGIEPAAFLVERVGGGRVRVQSLLKGHQDPHTYEPTPRRMADLAGAKAFFLVGLPFEGHLAKKLGSGAGAPRVVDLGTGVPRRRMETGLDQDHEVRGDHERDHDKNHESESHGHHHQHGQWDPHIWLSPRLASIMAANAARTLTGLDPDGREIYQRNLKALQDDLERMDLKIASMLAPFKGRTVMVYHPAFGYFLDEYGLRQLAVQTEGKEPGGRELAQLIALARRQGVKIIFLQKSQASAGARQVARSVGAVVAELDPLAHDYLANLERMARALAKALSGGAKP